MLPIRLMLSCCLLACATHGLQAKEKGVPGLQGAIPIKFELDEASTVSAGIYNTQGQLLRPLFQAVELEAGDHRIDWDGMDKWVSYCLPALKSR